MMGFVYFIRPVGMPGPVKIGHSLNPEQRLHELDGASPFPLELAVKVEGDQAIERAIQNSFADCHSHREWFHPHPRLLRAIAALIAGPGVSEAIDLTHRGNVLGLISKATMKRNAERARREMAA
jgi:hypothetical protein